MAGKTAKTAKDEKTTDSVKGDDSAATVDDTGDENVSAETEGVSMEARKVVVFLGPHHRYSRGDTASFDAVHAEELVERNIAVWPKDAKRAMAPKPGDNDFDTDIG